MIVSWIILGFLIVYQHVLWPYVLRFLAKKQTRGLPSHAEDLRNISLIIPVHNEEDTIEAKLWNLTILDYPPERLDIIIICDGCTDNTISIIEKVTAHDVFSTMNIMIESHADNRGKLAVLNEYIPLVSTDIVALSDCSALLAVDSMQLASKYFEDESVGVVCGSYHMLNHGSDGEQKYWEYQRAIKQAEGVIGSVIGAHGAFYLFRFEYFHALKEDTINDDFILPMDIVAQGYRAVYSPEMVTVELECATDGLDWNRRKRIGAGNMQQAIRLICLLHPKHNFTALSFFSSKVLRAFMPFILIVFLAMTLALCIVHSLIFIPFLLAQVLVYSLTMSKNESRIVKILRYLVIGHVANLIGATRYILRLEKDNWKRAEEKEHA